MPSAMSAVPVVVCDMGTETTRLGYAGNATPTCVFPTMCAWTDPLSFDTLRIGDDAHVIGTPAAPTRSGGGGVSHRRGLLDHGCVVDWDLYEEYWRQLFNQRLCVESSDVGVVLAEAARAPPDERETIAEILFESFGVAQLCVGSQALFALSSLGEGCDTAAVVMGGAGVTQVVPVVDGYAVNGAAAHFPVAGRDITQYVLDSLREHERNIEAASAWAVAEEVKTRHAYVTANLATEMARFDAGVAARVVRHRAVHSRTGQPYAVEVGYEQFVAPETFFQPALLHPEWTAALTDVVDAVLWSCPIDSRRRLYTNVVVCGGGMRFSGLAKRLEQELRDVLTTRAASFMAASSGASGRPVAYDVHVHDCSQDLDCVWRGGSVLGGSARFAEEATTRAEYEERGYFRAGLAL